MSDIEVTRHVCGAWIVEGAICRACETAYGLCPKCGKNRMPQTGSRPSVYCSDNCRKATHRSDVGIPRDVSYEFNHQGREWVESAKCREIDPELFFLDPNEYGTRAFKVVLEVCGGCTVRVPCLKEGIQNKHGIWAGWTPAQRKELEEILDRFPTKTARDEYLAIAADRGPRVLLQK